MQVLTLVLISMIVSFGDYHADPERIQQHMNHLTKYYSRASKGKEAQKCAKWIEDYYAGLGLEVILQDWSGSETDWSWDDKARYPNGTYSPNVIGILEGKSSRDVIVISGHYDSRGPNSNDNPTERAPGADDNASGASMVFEAARISVEKYNGTAPPYSVHFLSSSGEEEYLFGAYFYAQRLLKANYNVHFAMNADMISYLGGGPLQIALIDHKDNGIGNYGNWTNDSNEYAMNILRKHFPHVHIGYSKGCCSDEMAFMNFGIPAVSFFERVGKIYADNPVYHTPKDILSLVNYSQVALVTDAVLTILDELQTTAATP